jgi:hypothetical protein
MPLFSGHPRRPLHGPLSSPLRAWPPSAAPPPTCEACAMASAATERPTNTSTTCAWGRGEGTTAVTSSEARAAGKGAREGGRDGAAAWEEARRLWAQGVSGRRGAGAGQRNGRVRQLAAGGRVRQLVAVVCEGRTSKMTIHTRLSGEASAEPMARLICTTPTTALTVMAYSASHRKDRNRWRLPLPMALPTQGQKWSNTCGRAGQKLPCKAGCRDQAGQGT